VSATPEVPALAVTGIVLPVVELAEIPVEVVLPAGATASADGVRLHAASVTASIGLGG
jgi:hypothetical protein